MIVPTWCENPQPEIMLVGECPGETEDRKGVPFKGKAGRTLDKLLAQAGITRYDCAITNVAREMPPGKKVGFYFEDAKRTRPKPILQGWLNELRDDIERLKPNIIVALGGTALWGLTGTIGIEEARGFFTECTLVPGVKVLPTYHPQKINYEWKLAFTAIMDLRKALTHSHSPEILKDNRKLNAFPSALEFAQYLEWLLHDFKEPISVDIETTSNAHIDILGIADSPNHAMSYSFITNKRPKLTPEGEFKIWDLVAQVLDEREAIMHNGMYDAAVLWHHNHILCRKYWHDTMVQTHVCWPETRRSLSYVSSICLDVPMWKHLSGDMPTLYNCSDAANTYGVWEVLEKEIDKQKVRHTYNFEMSEVWPAMMMQLQGVDFNKERQNKLKANIESRMLILERDLEQGLGKTVNLRSPQQVKDVLYIDMALPEQFKRRKSVKDPRKTTSDAEAITKLSRTHDNPLLDIILEWKKLDKLLNTFVDISISPEGKVHTSYNITGATMAQSGTGKQKGLIVDDEKMYKSFGRWSSSKSIILPYGSGNLQAVPYAARLCYTAPKGFSWVMADYIQAEAVVVAYIIGDAPMIKMFQDSFGASRKERAENNWDIHKITAANNFGISIEEVTKELRDIGKTLRHAINYSAGPGVVSSKLNCSMNEAKNLITVYHNTCPQLRLWHKRIQAELRNTSILYNLLGRKHRFLERWNDDLFRSAYAYIPQSTVGDLLNTSLIKVYNEHGSDLIIALQLHDAIYNLVEDREVDNTIKMLRDCMLMELETNSDKFTIDVDFAIGSNGASWGELEEV